MSRDQRVHDNWALLFAQKTALKENKPLIVIFNLINDFLEAGVRQYSFMLRGLEETEKELKKYNIPFFLLQGKPTEEIPKFIKSIKACSIITDFDPLKIKRIWKKEISKNIDIPFFEVDTHNIVPCFFASNKQEFGAYTIRPKIHRNMTEFLDEYSGLKKMKVSESLRNDKIIWNEVLKKLKVDKSVGEVHWITPGSKAALKTLKKFINRKLNKYNDERNDPTKDGQSNLSPYLHFGQISPQRVAIEIYKSDASLENKKAFLEELIVRRELSDNFCYYNNNYDSFLGFPNWANQTLNEHKKDKREFIYAKKEFENAATHEDLWNAAQRELVKNGKLHGYMRMYWAKKILEWSKSPEEALKIVLYLNDKYELDGRDPNGYAGCAWAVGGVHDRAWGERPVFGKIRYMNRNGAARKFDIKKYINKFG